MSDEHKPNPANRPRDLASRTQEFAIRVIKMFGTLGKSYAAQTVGKQVFRSATSVGAHFREGRRSRSDAEIVSKWQVALQELDETAYWLDLLLGADLVKPENVVGIRGECNELLAILTASVKTVKARITAETMNDER